MGNRIGKKRQVVDEKYTRPQGAYPHRDIDHKKLRKLILECKLAPCYPGSEECFLNQEECPICFLYYPSLNRSRCCMKGICTECFLQMKPSHSSRPTQCPYCKTSNYAVEYRGERTREERSLEQIEEQKVIEAQIKVRHQEIQDEQERMKRRQEVCSSNRVAASEEVECHDDANSLLSAPSHPYQEQGPGFVSSRSLTTIPVDTQFHIRQHRSMEEHFDMDLEELMVMEAIWLSIQEQESQANDNATSTEVASMVGEMASANNLSGGWLDGPIMAVDDGESSGDNCSEVAEAGTSYSGSDIAVMDATQCACLLDGLDSAAMTANRLLPESFEEQQMMVAMAVSLAESRLAWM